MNKKWPELVQLFRIFIVIMIISFSTTILLGATLVAFNPQINISSGKAVHIPVVFFSNLLSLEAPYFQAKTHTINSQSTMNFLLTFLLDVELNNPKALVAGIIPGVDSKKSTLLYPGSDTEGVIDYPGNDERSQNEIIEPKNNPLLPKKPSTTNIAPPKDNHTKTPIDNEKNAEIFIYHSHNRESWLPELPDVEKEYLAFDKKINVTLLGDRLANKLSEAGINSIHDSTDYQSVYSDIFKSSDSYLYSRKKVKEAKAANKQLKYYFDIHRDSGPRKATTTKINGIDYAQLFIIIGSDNPKWKENYKFAKEFIKVLNNKYPGLSKGIFAKDRKQGNGVYNQDLSIKNIIIEIGGVNNNREESNRTIDALSKVITELYKNDVDIKKVNSL